MRTRQTVFSEKRGSVCWPAMALHDGCCGRPGNRTAKKRQFVKKIRPEKGQFRICRFPVWISVSDSLFPAPVGCLRKSTGASEPPLFPVFSSAGCGQSFVFWGNKTVGGKFFFFCGVFLQKYRKLEKTENVIGKSLFLSMSFQLFILNVTINTQFFWLLAYWLFHGLML